MRAVIRVQRDDRRGTELFARQARRQPLSVSGGSISIRACLSIVRSMTTACSQLVTRLPSLGRSQSGWTAADCCVNDLAEFAREGAHGFRSDAHRFALRQWGIRIRLAGLLWSGTRAALLPQVISLRPDGFRMQLIDIECRRQCCPHPHTSARSILRSTSRKQCRGALAIQLHGQDHFRVVVREVRGT